MSVWFLVGGGVALLILTPITLYGGSWDLGPAFSRALALIAVWMLYLGTVFGYCLKWLL